MMMRKFRYPIILFSIAILVGWGGAVKMTEGNLTGEAPGNSTILDTGQVVFQFTAPFNNTDGMAWDGTNLWIGCDGLDRIWKYDTLGNLLDSIPAPNTTATGLAWDGTYLWCADGGTMRIYKLDPATGNILDSIPAPGTGTSCEGLAWMNDTLWNTNWADTYIWWLDPATGTIWGQFPAQSTGSTGLTWDWHDNVIWNSDQSSILIYKLDPVTGAVITSFASPDAQPQDLAFDGTYLWICGWTSGEVYKMDIGYVGVEEVTDPHELSALVHSYPNPMRLETEIMYQLPNRSKVCLKIYDFTGQLIRTLVNEDKNAGHHKAVWDSKDDSGAALPSGVYFYRIETESYTASEKLVLLN